MKKAHFVPFLTFATAIGLQAQTEPEKTPATKKSPTDTKKAAAKTQTAPVPNSGAKGSGDAGAQAKTEVNAKPIDSSNFDTSVKPSDDFFLYANGGWGQSAPIPPEPNRRGSFHTLIERDN